MEKQIFTSFDLDELKQIIRDCISNSLLKESQTINKEEKEEELLTIDSIQKLFRVSKVTIHKWKKKGLRYKHYSLGTMFGLFFCEEEVTNYEDAKKSDLKKFADFHAKMLKKGIYLAPSQFEAGLISSAHTKADINATLEAIWSSINV